MSAIVSPVSETSSEHHHHHHEMQIPEDVQVALKDDPTVVGPGPHPLGSLWSFSFCHRPPGVKGNSSNYVEQMKVEAFWAVYSHLKRPSQLPIISDYHFFRKNIKPVWEDDGNVNGGKWIVRIKKGLADRFWENLVLALACEEFEDGHEVCGAVLSLRSSEDIISLWNKNANVPRINLRIRDTIKRVLHLPTETVMEYKAHKDALVDNSSFRNTDVFT